MKNNLKRISALILGILMMGIVFSNADTLTGDANVDGRNYPSTQPFIHPPFYNVVVNVTVKDGKIEKVEDGGTGTEISLENKDKIERWGLKNKPYWEHALKAGLFEKFVEKTLEEVKAMQMDKDQVDSISGATMIGIATQEAIINSFEGKKGRKFLNNTGTVLPVVEINENTVIMENKLPEDFKLKLLDIRYGVYNETVVDSSLYSFTLENDKVKIMFNNINDLKPGKYYVNVVDESNTYRAPHFESGKGEVDEAQAPFFIIENKNEIVKIQNNQLEVENGDINDYMNNIKHVIIKTDVKEVEQAPVGHHGTINKNFDVFTKDGMLNAEAKFRKKGEDPVDLFNKGETYTITIEAYGYNDFTFTYTK